MEAGFNEMLKHRDSFGKERKKFNILVIQYPKYFWTTFKLWTEVRLTIILMVKPCKIYL